MIADIQTAAQHSLTCLHLLTHSHALSLIHSFTLTHSLSPSLNRTYSMTAIGKTFLTNINPLVRHSCQACSRGREGL